MEWAVLIISAVASFAAVASAIVAIAQARSARTSEADALDARDEARVARDESARLAREANETFKRVALAQEKSIALRERELTPPAWSGPRWISGEMYAMTNTSGNTVKVNRFDVEPDEALGFMRLYGSENGTYKVGDSFEYVAARTSSLRPRKLTIFWRYESDPEATDREFIPL